MSQPLRAGHYYRKSSDRQEDSIGRQRDQVTPYSSHKGYQKVMEEADEGIAGDVFGDRRPGLQRILAAAKNKEIDVIVVDEPSRLSRQDPVEAIEKIVAPLKRAGVKVDTVSKGLQDYDTLAGLIMMTVDQHKSVEESKDLSRRVLTAIVRRVKAGNWFGWNS